MTILWSNNASTTVSGSITAGSTSVALAAGTGALFPNPTGGDYFVATFYDQATKTQNEIVHVTAMAGDVATIVRAQEGTTAKAWNAGDILANLVTAGTLRAFVQAGTGPANTSLVYVGTDTSATPNLIVAVTNPVPSSYAVGMLFNIKVANTNTGPVNVQLNGTPSVILKRTDGSDMVAGNLIAGEEYTFLYGGGAGPNYHFDSTIPPIPRAPPQTTFYVRADSTSVVDANGIESATGFANTTTDAFKTLQGAINTINQRFISSLAITIRVADGYYNSGFVVANNYVAGWIFIGNPANPGNVIIDGTSTNTASYVPHAPPGYSLASSGPAALSVQGFTCKSYYQNMLAIRGGNLSIDSCNFTNPTAAGGVSVINAQGGGNIQLTGTCNYSSNGSTGELFLASTSGYLQLGGHDSTFGSSPLAFSISGAPSFIDATARASSGGVIQLMSYAPVTFPGVVPTGKQYLVDTTGGIGFENPAQNFPGSQPGVIGNLGWLA
jgi:hypothetical protein